MEYKIHKTRFLLKAFLETFIDGLNGGKKKNELNDRLKDVRLDLTDFERDRFSQSRDLPDLRACNRTSSHGKSYQLCKVKMVHQVPCIGPYT